MSATTIAELSSVARTFTVREASHKGSPHKSMRVASFGMLT